MSPSNLFGNALVNYADVQPSEPKPFDDRQPKANTIVSRSAPTKDVGLTSAQTRKSIQTSKPLGSMDRQEANRTEQKE
ncbi:hypothetical protein BOTNAR_0915g00010 [Botryotinia narcissicola]|uniref:Uncharacterized protein n=1 Tax=Botryotinia narcissicola TaxID=278944 RepID=A0A4Z1HBP9_9HELO|nr:hypothetical protein BOTNAR_0915g00010 [Botryotinia narcissicola]